MSTSTETVTDHVWYVYVVWGIALAVLLLQLRRAMRFSAAPRVPRYKPVPASVHLPTSSVIADAESDDVSPSP